MFGFFNKRNKPVHKAESEVQDLQQAILPSEVVAFLSRRIELNAPDLTINILDAAMCAKMTLGMRSISVGKHLGLVVLDDANDSNPYCYITGGVAAGMVVHFNHDPEPRIEFESLNAFEEFLRELRASNQRLGEVEITSPAHPHQAALGAVLSELAQIDDHQDIDFLICMYLPLLRGGHRHLLERLGAHKNFFVREAVAEAIASAHLTESSDVIRALADDTRPQVRSAAASAAAVLRRVCRDD